MPKPLPSPPSLEQLKIQAKEFLKAVQSRHPDALARLRLSHLSPTLRVALQDAQRIVAREYGFASWAKLKRHVESFAPDPMEAFAAAFRNNDVARVQTLLSQHASLRKKLNQGFSHFGSPIIFQARGNPQMLDALLAAGADINARSDWWAGGFGILDGTTQAQAKFLIRRGAKLDVHSAAHLGWLDELKKFIAANPSLVHARGGDGQTPLHFARTIGVAEFLLDRGADMDARDVDHESTPAQWMLGRVGKGGCARHDVARYLVKRGCHTDILMAAALGDAALVRKHLDENPDFIRTRVSEEFFPMIGEKTGGTIYQWTLGWYVSPHEVAKKFHHETVYHLLLRRSPPDVKLLVACWLGDQATVEENREQVARLSPSDLKHVAHAARNNRPRAVRLMLEAGFPVDARGQEGGTPLHWAAWHGNLPMLKTILRFHPPLDLQDAAHHSTPLGWAIHASEHGWQRGRGNYAGCVEALLAAGATPPAELGGTEAVKKLLRRHR